MFFGKIPPLRGLFTNLRESIKEAKSINQPDAKPGIKKPRPKRHDKRGGEVVSQSGPWTSGFRNSALTTALPRSGSTGQALTKCLHNFSDVVLGKLHFPQVQSQIFLPSFVFDRFHLRVRRC